MKTIYELQQIANRLRQATEVNSISPEDTFGLQSDVLEYLANMEQSAEGLGIHKVYANYATMLADCDAPIGSNGKALRFGQLVVLYDPSNPTQAESGNVYAWQRGNTGAAAWLLMGNLGSVYALQAQISSLSQSLESEAGSLGERIDALQNALDTLTDADTTDAIESFKEILDFLDGVKDDETLTGKLTTLGSRITELERTVGLNEAFFRMAIEMGRIDDNGEEAPDDTPAEVDGQGHEVLPPTTKVRTQLLTLPEGSYHISVSNGSDLYLCKYNNGVFVEKVSIGSSGAFTVTPNPLQYGVPAFNQIRLTYSRNNRQLFAKNEALLYGTVGNLLSVLDNCKADQKEFEKLQRQVGRNEDAIEGLNSDLTQLLGMVANSNAALENANRSHHTIRFNGIVNGEVSFEQNAPASIPTGAVVVWCESAKTFAIRIGQRYYNTWEGETDYMDSETLSPYPEKQYILDGNIYMYDTEEEELRQVGGSSVSSIFNATNEVPVQGYYTLCDIQNEGLSAVHAAWNAKKAVSGLIISFEISAGIWKTFQYIGKTVTEANWLSVENWKDFGSLAAGSEAYIVIDGLIGAPVAGQYYTLETAVARLVAYQRESGVNYAKKGLIISYRTGENAMETKQFQGEVSGFGEVGLWKDFGGGSEIEGSDEPEENGRDAFTTGGAYNHIPVAIAVDTETDGVVKMKLVNAGGEDVGDEVQFPVGTGTGGSTGTTIAIAFEHNPFHGKAGGTFLVKAAIMSVTKATGNQETSNSIMSVVFVNRTTKNTVASFSPRQASSLSLSNFSFEFDLSSLCQDAGEVSLQAVVTDDSGNTATKNLSLVSVDVTCVSVQTLNYTRETSLQVGGPRVSIPMYKFPNRASDIMAKIEIMKNGEWETLQEVLVRDSHPHNVIIDPTGLGHGAYPLRIQGTDVVSGTRGNILHTAVMVIEQREEVSNYNDPIIVARWSDDTGGTVKLFETLQMDIACYQRNNINPSVEVTVTDQTTGDSEYVSTRQMNRGSYYTVEKRIIGFSEGDTLVFDAVCGNVSLAETRDVLVHGSLLGIAETEGAFYKISLAGRSNTDVDKSIKTEAADSSEIAVNVNGANYSTNGFVLDTFGTEQSGGRMSLRVAENVTAECSDTPFASPSIPQNGLALSMTFKVKNIANRNARIISCMSERLGFVLTGEKFIVTTNGDSIEALKSVFTTAATSYLDDTVYRIDVVIEPQSRAPYSGVMLCKVFQNGDMAACVPIDTTNGFPSFDDTIHFDGTDADLYLYEIVRWNSYYDFIQAFNNYIVNITDTQAMLTEYEQNQVMSDVAAEGTTKPRPDMQRLLERGIMVCVETRTADSNLSEDGAAVTDSERYYPDYIENIKDKETEVLMDLRLYFPERPWADCIVEAVPGTNQGTSTLAYAIKNKKFKFKKSKGITLLHTREEISQMYGGDEEILAKYDDAASLARKKQIRIKEGSTPVNKVTVKVDYSDSAGANNCALMELMNDTQIALGGEYMTPAQRFNTNSSETFHTSIDGVTCALFRTDYRVGLDKGPQAATLPENAYFHSKANFNADKGNPHFFGFEDVKGYNKGCVNYGDFKEIVTPRGRMIETEAAASFTDVDKTGEAIAYDDINRYDWNTVYRSSDNKFYRYSEGYDIDDYKDYIQRHPDVFSLVPGELYMVSEFCGPEYRFLENDGTGSMVETTPVSDYVDIDFSAEEIAADSPDFYDWTAIYRSNDGRFFRYGGGNWEDTTGTMTFDQNTGKWNINGNVLNPVECYEYRQYQEFCWQQGVNSVDDLLVPQQTDSGTVPIWTTYYESRYPDDDDLNDLYTQGKKVPYQLFRQLAFCQQCNQNLTDDAAENAATNPDGSEKVFNGAGASTTIMLDGVPVAGTKANRLLKWQHEMHKVFSPQSVNCYIVASDYKATVDQRAKNMMVTAYKETDGNIRFYFNHWYDGDSVDEADNDCYLTIPWDMDGATSHLYQGWDGVMFRQSYALFERGEGVWIDDNGTMLTLHDTAAAMRATKTGAGLEIFSAEGCYRYWMTNRILKWPKVVSSFDGERKYIETATAADNHYPALHGLRLDSLPSFQRKRFAYRDGYYQTGDLFRHFFQARVMGSITVKIRAAQDGYFGMGVDSTSSAKYSCYLNAGESHTFNEVAAGVGGKLIYIFGADKISELDLSGCTPKNSNWVIADCTLLRRLVIGGSSYNPSYTDDILSALSLGRMPFLEEIDISNTKILTLNASGCPRLKRVYAEGSLLKTLALPESAPIDTLHLPQSVTNLSFVNLPNLSYPGGLTIGSMSNVTRLHVYNSPKINGAQLLTDVIGAGSTIQSIHLSGMRNTGASSILLALKNGGATGLESDGRVIDESGQCSGMTGRWVMSDFISDETLASLQSYFPGMSIYNSQYSHIYFSDDVGTPANITNADNQTGWDYTNDYVPSAHISKIWDRMTPCIGLYDKTTGKMTCIPLDERDYTKLADGRNLSTTYDRGEYDAFMLIPHYWYKGVNHFKEDKKHLFYSSEATEPISSANVQRRQMLNELLFQSGCSVCTDSADTGIYDPEGNLKVDGSTTFVRTNSGYNTYRMDVEGMKQVRWPGVSSSRIGAIFVDSEGEVVGTYNLTGMSGDSDFVDGDYVFTSVPTGAKYIIFAVKVGFTNDFALAVDSSEVEAIEPDWVEHEAELVGIYEAAMVSGTLRSVSGVAAKVGDGTGNTYAGWTYETDGHVRDMDPMDVADLPLHYTYKDFQNLAWLRGEGYQMIDYETSKDVANLFFAIVGNRDGQYVCGQGRTVGSSANNGWCNNYNTGAFDSIGKAKSAFTSNSGNKVLGIENFMACNSEWMDNVAVNVVDYVTFKRNRMNSVNADPTDAVWHIYDPISGTERTVQGINVQSGYCIGRVKFGRFCDVVPSKVTSDTSRWNQNYCDGFWYQHQPGRVVNRSHSGASACGGLVFAHADHASSNSNASIGTRLAFRGAIEIAGD